MQQMGESKMRQERLSLPGFGKGSARADTQKVIDSKALFQGDRELRIVHNDNTYRLTITKLGKLILTK